MFSIHLHIVWITKYRKPILVGDVGYKVRELLREICRSESVEIVKGHVSKRPCAPVCVDSAAGDDKQIGAEVERQKFV